MTNVCILRFSLPEKQIEIMEGTKYLLSRRKKLINNSDIPQHAIESIARCILPDILAYYESEEGQKEFAKWKADLDSEQFSEPDPYDLSSHTLRKRSMIGKSSRNLEIVGYAYDMWGEAIKYSPDTVAYMRKVLYLRNL